MTAEEYDAVVYDLDGTLVRLAVDWEAVARDVATVLRDRGVDVGDADLWWMLEQSGELGYRDVVEETIAEYERDGARGSTRLPLADAVDGSRPSGVCSLNCEAAVRIALETHGLDGAIDAVVGRDSVATEKPDPEPLLATVERLSATPARTLFVGDSERDERTADRAGTDFVYVEDWCG